MLTDRFGAKLLPGVCITYPSHSGSKHYMADAVIEAVEDRNFNKGRIKVTSINRFLAKPVTVWLSNIEHVTAIFRPWEDVLRTYGVSSIRGKQLETAVNA